MSTQMLMIPYHQVAFATHFDIFLKPVIFAGLSHLSSFLWFKIIMILIKYFI